MCSPFPRQRGRGERRALHPPLWSVGGLEQERGGLLRAGVPFSELQMKRAHVSQPWSLKR